MSQISTKNKNFPGPLPISVKIIEGDWSGGGGHSEHSVYTDIRPEEARKLFISKVALCQK